jgi:hypothetical protein
LRRKVNNNRYFETERVYNFSINIFIEKRGQNYGLPYPHQPHQYSSRDCLKNKKKEILLETRLEQPSQTGLGAAYEDSRMEAKQ